MSTPAPRLEVRTLGRLDVSGTREQTRLSVHRKPLALLVLLAVERSTPRERAIGLLWGDSAPEKARHSLSQALVLLRNELPECAIESGRDVITIGPDVWCDATAFDTALDEGRTEAAIALYSGTFLRDFDAKEMLFAQWADRRAAHYALRLRDAMRALIATAANAQRLEHALSWARRWVQLNPDEDEAQHRLIELLAASGRRSESLDRFELYRRALQHEELTPLDETLSLVERIRRGESLGPLTTMVRSPGPTAAPRTRRFGARVIEGPRLVRIADGGVEAESYYLHPGCTRIGRADCDITFPGDAALEVLHASITVTSGEGGLPRILLRDESESGGIFLRIRDTWPLLHGVRFRVGQQQFRLVEHEPPAPA